VGSGWVQGIVLDRGPEVLRDVAMATNFGTQFAITGFVGFNFGCMIASCLILWVGFRGQAIRWRHSRFQGCKECCHGNHFLAFYIWGAHWRHLVNTIEPSMCGGGGGDAALCQITLTACSTYVYLMLRKNECEKMKYRYNAPCSLHYYGSEGKKCTCPR